jgi:hypothetical protein
MSPTISSASSALQLLNQILIADHTTLRHRGLVTSLSTTPFLINAPLGAYLSSTIVQNTVGSWRLGCKHIRALDTFFLTQKLILIPDAFFALIIPLCLAPVVTNLLWSEYQARRLGLVPKPIDGQPDGGSPVRRRGNSSPLSPLHSRHASRRHSRQPSRGSSA